MGSRAKPTVTVRQLDGISILECKGWFRAPSIRPEDETALKRVFDELLGQSQPRIILNLAGIHDDLDWTITFVHYLGLTRSAGGRLVVVQPPQRIRILLGILGLAEIIFDDEVTAMASLAASGHSPD